MKGASFEREVNKELSLWFTNGQRDDVFGRCDCSGGRFTQRHKTGKDTAFQAGDVTFTDPLGIPLVKEWSIECKTGYGGKKRIKDKEGKTLGKLQKQWDILDCIDSKQENPVFTMLWKQCIRDAELSNRKPVLIFRRNLRAKCIVIKYSYFMALSSYFGDFKSPFFIFKTTEEKIIVMALKDFFEWIPSMALMLDQKQNASPALPSKSRFNRPK